ncbi:MAG: prefoldin subunit beta [Candidatus Hodarchaeota archaeon]
MAAPQIPPALQQQIRRFQELQVQLNDLRSVVVQLEQQIREIDRSLKELEKLQHDDSVYKSVGAILIKTNVEDVKKELIDSKETMELRLKTYNKQFENAKNELTSLRDKIVQQTQTFEGIGGPGLGG